MTVDHNQNGIDVSDLNMTEIQTTIRDLTGTEADKLWIWVETNDNNIIIRIRVIEDDEETANKNSKSINEKIDEQDQEGFLRNC